MKLPIYLFSVSSHPEAMHINSLTVAFFKPKIDFTQTDYLILTSKQAVKALEQYDKEEFIQKKALCISKATAKAYKELGGEVLEVGKGYGDTLVDAIKNYPKTTKWLYLRAEVVASDFADVLREDGYAIKEAILYKSECSKEILDAKVKRDAILIFTSPSSIKCYLKTHPLFSSQKIIVIGKTTAKALPKDIDYILSPNTTVESCIQIAKKLTL
ncbi:Uroporphyrinogen-III synthase [hydrothermal vent metagenome]|uniref:Uroporphyrinogen-III synthase n=1 Tax=hydrothermal vent metagenome TaxID=652676 RepID=A0A1W1BWB5_9ZZZZ